MGIYCDIFKSFGNMIRRKVRSIKLKRYNLTGRTDQSKLLISQRKNLCKSCIMLSFTLSNEALNLSKPDMQKQNRSSEPLRSDLWLMNGRRCCFLKKYQTISYWSCHTPSKTCYMLHEMNSIKSFPDIIQQNKIWVNRIWQ